MSRGGQNRESGRLKESKRILDDATRQRRAKQAIEALEKDNFHDDPHGDLVANKNAPKFQDTLRESRKGRSNKAKTLDYYKFKYRKTLAQMTEYENVVRPKAIKYSDANAPQSPFPPRNFCSVCGFPSTYKCITCGAKYCSVNCLGVHSETRCLKWTA